MKEEMNDSNVGKGVGESVRSGAKGRCQKESRRTTPTSHKATSPHLTSPPSHEERKER